MKPQTALSIELQTAFNKINTLLEAKLKTLEQRLKASEPNVNESLNTYIESYY